MPSSVVRTFTDPDDYAAAIRGGTVQLTITGRGDFNAKLTRIDLHRLWMQRFSDNLPRIIDMAEAVTGRAYLFFAYGRGRVCSRLAWRSNRPASYGTAKPTRLISAHLDR
jgi:hypothetical protein